MRTVLYEENRVYGKFQALQSDGSNKYINALKNILTSVGTDIAATYEDIDTLITWVFPKTTKKY